MTDRDRLAAALDAIAPAEPEALTEYLEREGLTREQYYLLECLGALRWLRRALRRIPEGRELLERLRPGRRAGPAEVAHDLLDRLDGGKGTP